VRLYDILDYLQIDSNEYKDIDIDKINTLSDANNKEISFLSNKKYLNDLQTTKAGAIFVSKEHIDRVPLSSIAIVCDNPYINIALISKLFAKPIIDTQAQKAIISKSAVIQINVYMGGDTIIEDDVTIMAGSYVGDRVVIGKGSIIYPNVSILNDTKIGQNCIINAGAVIGSDGFGFAPNHDDKPIKIYHIGDVIIEDDVEIGSNSTIDKAVYGHTIIQSGTKLDNLIQIGHNVHIGKNNFMAAQSGVAGSSKIGNNNMFGAQSGVSGHLEIGDNSTIYARGGVTKNLKSNQQYAGFPIVGHKEWIKKEVAISRLSKGK